MRKLTTNSILSLELPVSGDKDTFHSLYGEGTFQVGDLFPAFTGIKKGQGVFLAPTISQATLTPNNQYAKVVICRAGLFCSPALGTPRQSSSEAKSPSAICNDILHSQSHETISHQVAEKGKKLLAKLACECFPGQKDS